MLTCETTIRMERPGRYLVQFCRHAAAMGKTDGGHRPPVHSPRAALVRGDLQVHAEYTDTRGVVTISPWGRCILQATTDTLTLRVEATDQDTVRQIQDIVTKNLERFGRRDEVTVTWPPPQVHDTGPATADVGATARPAGLTAAGVNRRNAILLAVVAIVAIAIHLMLGAGILVNWRWGSLSADVVLVIVLLKGLLIAFGGRTLRAHIRPRRTHLHAWARHRSGAERGHPGKRFRPPERSRHGG